MLCLGFTACWAQWHWQRGEIFDVAVGHECVEFFIDDGVTLTWAHVPSSPFPGHHFWRWTIGDTSNGNVTFNTDPNNDSVEPLDSNYATHPMVEILQHTVTLSGDQSPAALGLFVDDRVGCPVAAVVPVIWVIRRLWRRNSRPPHACPCNAGAVSGVWECKRPSRIRTRRGVRDCSKTDFL